jgi:hypothetical protein
MAYVGTPIDTANQFQSLQGKRFNGDGSTTAFTLDIAPSSVFDIEVFVENVRQDPNSAYALSGTTMTFTSAPASGTNNIYVIHQAKSVGTIDLPEGALVDLNGGSDKLVLDADGDTTISADTDDQIDLKAGGTDTMHIINGKVGITNVPDLGAGLHIKTADSGASVNGNGDELVIENNGNAGLSILTGTSDTGSIFFADADDSNVGAIQYDHSSTTARMVFRVEDNTRLKLDSSANVLYNKTSTTLTDTGIELRTHDAITVTRGAGAVLDLNRQTNDGDLVIFYQGGNAEGTISISGTTTSYNGFTGTHWSRLADNSKPTILKGTILESLDTMMDWYQAVATVPESTDDNGNVTAEHPIKKSISLNGRSVGDDITFTVDEKEYTGKIEKEGDIKHTKCKVSDTDSSKNVYGLFNSWDEDEDTVNDMYVAQVGTFVIRIHKDETVAKGDLIQSKGDGTGKVQADDIMRSSTVAKVLSTTKIETYSDGSYIVPCSLHC